MLYCAGCGDRCDAARVHTDGQLEVDIGARRAPWGRQFAQYILTGTLAERLAEPPEWHCRHCGMRLRLDGDQLRRVGHNKRIICTSMPTDK
jgi:hypothetical protein